MRGMNRSYTYGISVRIVSQRQVYVLMLSENDVVFLMYFRKNIVSTSNLFLHREKCIYEAEVVTQVKR